MAMILRASRSAMQAWAWRPNSQKSSSSPSRPPSQPAWALACRLAARLSRATGVGCGRRPTKAAQVRPSLSRSPRLPTRTLSTTRSSVKFSRAIRTSAPREIRWIRNLYFYETAAGREAPRCGPAEFGGEAFDQTAASAGLKLRDGAAVVADDAPNAAKRLAEHHANVT